MPNNSPFFTTLFLGHANRIAQVGKKSVITILVPDYYLSKKTGRSEVDAYQVNLFSQDAQRLQQENPDFNALMTALNRGEVIKNYEFSVKISMSKQYTNKRGETVYPHPEFKLVDVQAHDMQSQLDKLEPTELEAARQDLSFTAPF